MVTNKVFVKSELVRYIALSYVWGKGREEYAATGSVAIWKASQSPGSASAEVDLTVLPKAIQDAADLLKAINHRYLWVDVFCIRQGCPEDKAAVVSQMGAIYSGAWLTIVAAGGHGAASALPRFCIRRTGR